MNTVRTSSAWDCGLCYDVDLRTPSERASGARSQGAALPEPGTARRWRARMRCGRRHGLTISASRPSAQGLRP